MAQSRAELLPGHISVKKNGGARGDSALRTFRGPLTPDQRNSIPSFLQQNHHSSRLTGVVLFSSSRRIVPPPDSAYVVMLHFRLNRPTSAINDVMTQLQCHRRVYVSPADSPCPATRLGMSARRGRIAHIWPCERGLCQGALTLSVFASLTSHDRTNRNFGLS